MPVWDSPRRVTFCAGENVVSVATTVPKHSGNDNLFTSAPAPVHTFPKLSQRCHHCSWNETGANGVASKRGASLDKTSRLVCIFQLDTTSQQVLVLRPPGNKGARVGVAIRCGRFQALVVGIPPHAAPTPVKD